MSVSESKILFESHKPNNHNFKDLTGQRFSRLLVQAFVGRIAKYPKRSKSVWLCKCDCGQQLYAAADNLKGSTTRSCGCLKRETASKKQKTHGESVGYKRSPELRTFERAKTRCNNSLDISYPLYGGRGIEFRFTSFEEWFTCLGRRPSKYHSIDRIDPNGHYEPGNVRWATKKEQGRNKRNNTRLTFRGLSKIIPEWMETPWAKQIGLHTKLVENRHYRYKWCDDCCLTIPPGGDICTHKRK